MSYAEQLQTDYVGCSIAFEWLGTSKAINKDQSRRAAEEFQADAKSVSARKKIYDTSRPEFKAVNQVRAAAREYWQSCTLPYPVDGVRLLPRRNIESFAGRMAELTAQLASAVEALNAVAEDIREDARTKLGELYDPADYLMDYSKEFSLSFGYPSLEPPAFMRELHPAVYERESAACRARFDEAVQLAEQAFRAELAELIERLTDRLTGADDGKPKIFRDSSVDNFREFFQRFKALNVGSSQELNDLVALAEQRLDGVSPEALRKSVHLRDSIREDLAKVAEQLDGSIVARPTRRIVNPNSSPVLESAVA